MPVTGRRRRKRGRGEEGIRLVNSFCVCSTAVYYVVGGGGRGGRGGFVEDGRRRWREMEEAQLDYFGGGMYTLSSSKQRSVTVLPIIPASICGQEERRGMRNTSPPPTHTQEQSGGRCKRGRGLPNSWLLEMWRPKHEILADLELSDILR